MSNLTRELTNESDFTPVSEVTGNEIFSGFDPDIGPVAVSAQALLNAASAVTKGASEDADPTDNDIVFSSLKNTLAGKMLDLAGKTWPVTEVPDIKARNGFWLVIGLEGEMPVRVPAFDTIRRKKIILSAGQDIIGWTQGTGTAFGGLSAAGHMQSTNHSPGTQNWSFTWFADAGKEVAREERDIDFGDPDGEAKVFSTSFYPPTAAGGAPGQLAIAHQGSDMKMYYRTISQFVRYGSPGGKQHTESDWQEVTFTSGSFLDSLRARADSDYEVATSGHPTLIHSFSLYGAVNAETANGWFGFHGLSGLSAGPFLGYVSGTPRDGEASVSLVANIGGLSQGVEPTVTWCKQGGSSRLCGFIRSQGTSYPVRFWTASSLARSSIETAAIQDMPWGNDVSVYSPVEARIRPRREGSVSGWMPTWETVDGDASDELHFVFSGTRKRDGDAGLVYLFHGVVTRGTGLFEDMWERASITEIAPLYFANANGVQTSNQVGIPSLSFVDPNTLLISYSTERPAIAGDVSSSRVEVQTITLVDSYADPEERKLFDEGTDIPTQVHHLSTSLPHDRKQDRSPADSGSITLDGGYLETRGPYARVSPETGSTDVLTDISPGRLGDTLLLRVSSSTETITVNSTGNIDLGEGGDFVLDNARDILQLYYETGSETWVEVSRSKHI